MKLSSYLDPRFIYTGIEADTKEEVIREVIERGAMKERKLQRSKAEVIEGILSREEEISTCMGLGIAIPHARIEGFDDFFISIAVVENPIKCQVAALNQEDDVKVFFVIASEVLKNKRMLKVMSSLIKMATKNPKVLERIKRTDNPQEIYDLIKSIDMEIDGKILAEDVLSPDIQPVSPGETLEEVAKRLIVEGRTGFPIVSESGEFLGEITEKELIEFGMPKYISVMKDLSFLTVGEPFEEYLINEKTATIGDIYRKDDITTVTPKESIMEICFLIVNKGKTRLYVTDGKKYVGMIHRSDIIKKVLHI